MVALTFPDGARREYPPGTTGLDIAKGISPSLAKRTVAMALDGTVADLSDPIERDAKIEFLNREDPRALELIRHDAAHVLAEAVQSLWPGTQVTIGPVIENGFYYDFFRNQPFTLGRPARHRKEDEGDHRARQAVHQGSVVARADQEDVQRQGREFQGRAGRRHSGRPAIKIYKQGDWFDLCRGPHMTSTGKVGNAFKLMKVAGAYWRGDSTTRCSRASTAPPSPSRKNSTPISSRSRKPRSATIAGSAARWTSSISRKKRPARCSGIRKAGRCSRRWRTTSAAGRQESGFAEVNAPQLMDSSLWVPSGHMATFREIHVPDAAARGGRARLRHQADELPRPHPDFQERPEIVSRPAASRSPSSARCTASSRRARCMG